MLFSCNTSYVKLIKIPSLKFQKQCWKSKPMLYVFWHTLWSWNFQKKNIFRNSTNIATQHEYIQVILSCHNSLRLRKNDPFCSRYCHHFLLRDGIPRTSQYMYFLRRERKKAYVKKQIPNYCWVAFTYPLTKPNLKSTLSS